MPDSRPFTPCGRADRRNTFLVRGSLEWRGRMPRCSTPAPTVRSIRSELNHRSQRAEADAGSNPRSSLEGEKVKMRPNRPVGDEALHRVVVVGGGAAGLELVTWLGERLGRRGRVRVTLIDSGRVHLWKPLLHEVAAGSMDPGEYEVDYL